VGVLLRTSLKLFELYKFGFVLLLRDGDENLALDESGCAADAAGYGPVDDGGRIGLAPCRLGCCVREISSMVILLLTEAAEDTEPFL